MKPIETAYHPPVHTGRPDLLQSRGGALAVFFAIALGTFLVVAALSTMKGGVLNILFIIGGLLGLFVLALAVPQVSANYAYLKARLNSWHLVWYGIYVSSLVFRIRALADFQEQPVDSWALLRIGPELVIGLYLLGLLALRRLQWWKSLFTGLPAVLAVYSLFCLLTTFWSVFGAWTFYKSMEFLLDVTVISALLCVISSAEQYKTLFDFTWTVYGIETVWCWMQIAIWPTEALQDGRLKGVFPLTAYNALGEYGALLAIVSLARLMPITKGKFRQSWYIALLGFGIATMIAAQTRNAIGGVVLAAVLVLVLSRGLTGALMAGLAAGGVIFTALGALVQNFMQRGQSDEALEGLSGRLEWWRFAWAQFLEHPIAGLGAYAAGKFAVMKSLNVNSGSTHSDYIELLVGTGLVGFVLFVTAIIWTWRLLIGFIRDQACDPLERQLALEAFGVMVVLTVHSFFNVELIWHAPLFFLVVLGYAEFLRRKKAAIAVARARY